MHKLAVGVCCRVGDGFARKVSVIGKPELSSDPRGFNAPKQSNEPKQLSKAPRQPVSLKLEDRRG